MIMERVLKGEGYEEVETFVGFGQCPNCDKIGLLMAGVGTDFSEGRRYIRVKCILCGFSTKIYL